MQLLACVCNILACFVPELRDAAQCIQCIADLVFYTTAGCMFAQINYEWNERKKEGTLGGGSVTAQPVQAYAAPQPVAQGTVVGIVLRDEDAEDFHAVGFQSSGNGVDGALR